MTLMFTVNNEADEQAIWETYKRDGAVQVVHHGRRPEKLSGIGYWICTRDFPASADVNECEFDFYAGYLAPGGQYIIDKPNIPKAVLAQIFNGRLPEEMSIDWNAEAGSRHYVESSVPMTVKEAIALIYPALEDAKFQSIGEIY